jgi:hypothetical protein
MKMHWKTNDISKHFQLEKYLETWMQMGTVNCTVGGCPLIFQYSKQQCNNCCTHMWENPFCKT